MKMKKLTILLIISLVFSTALHAQSATSEQTNFIKRQYNSFRDDVKLIHKCYLKKTPACSENERAESKKAAVRVTKKGAALITAIIGTAAVGYLGYKEIEKFKEILKPGTLKYRVAESAPNASVEVVGEVVNLYMPTLQDQVREPQQLINDLSKWGIKTLQIWSDPQ